MLVLSANIYAYELCQVLCYCMGIVEVCSCVSSMLQSDVGAVLNDAWYWRRGATPSFASCCVAAQKCSCILLLSLFPF